MKSDLSKRKKNQQSWRQVSWNYPGRGTTFLKNEKNFLNPKRLYGTPSARQIYIGWKLQKKKETKLILKTIAKKFSSEEKKNGHAETEREFWKHEEKATPYDKHIPIRLSVDFSVDTLQTTRECDDKFKVLKWKKKPTNQNSIASKSVLQKMHKK